MIESRICVRMDETKKQRGNAILRRRGLTPTQCVNELYDRMIEKDDLIWSDRNRLSTLETSEILEALNFVRSIPKRSRFSTMSDDEIKLERLQSRGLLD